MLATIPEHLYIAEQHFQSLEEISADPVSQAARQGLYPSQGDFLQFNTQSNTLNGLEKSTTHPNSPKVFMTPADAKQLAKLKKKLPGSTDVPAIFLRNLIDQRDALLERLSTQVGSRSTKNTPLAAWTSRCPTVCRW